MPVNPYQTPRPLPPEVCYRTVQDGRWSLTLTGFFVGGYVGAWVGSLSGAGVGVLFALLAGGQMIGFQSPALTFVETLMTTGLMVAILGLVIGGGLGASLGMLLGSLVAVSSDALRRGFIWVSCIATCAAAMSVTAAMFRFDLNTQDWRPLGANHLEFVAHMAAIYVVGLGGFFGGGLLGRILREVAWEPGAVVQVVGEE